MQLQTNQIKKNVMETKIDDLKKYELEKEELDHLKGGGHWEKAPNGEYVWIDD